MPPGIESQQLMELIRALMGNARSGAFGGGPGAMMTHQAPFPVAGENDQGGGGLMGGIDQGYKAGGGGGMDKLKAMMGKFGGGGGSSPAGPTANPYNYSGMPNPMGAGPMGAAAQPGQGLKSAMGSAMGNPNPQSTGMGGSGMMSGLMKLFGR